MKHVGRGSFDYNFDTVNSLHFIKWYDRRAITLTSSFAKSESLGVCKRWDKTHKQNIEIQCPNIVHEYN